MFKKALLALSIAAVSTAAFAQNNITPSITGDGDLWIGAMGRDAAGLEITWLYNTDVSLSYFTPGSATSNTSFSQNVTGWSTFISNVANPATIQWMALAADTLGTQSTPGDFRYVGTSDKTAAQIQAQPTPQNFSNIDINGFAVQQNTVVTYHNTGSNTFLASSNVGNGFSIVQGTNNGSYNQNRLFNLGLPNGTALFDPDTSLDGSRNVIFFTRGASNGGAAPLVTIGNSFGNASMSLSSTGVFTYTAPIPEPGEWALMMAGLGIIGAIARRRRAA